MMEELLRASYIADQKKCSEKNRIMSFSGMSGENIFLNGPPKWLEIHFETLCGLRKPDMGEVIICERDPYEMTAREAADFRRDVIGAVPASGGMISELRMIDQIVLPMKLAGMDDESILGAIRELTSARMPLYDLYNLPGKCTARKQAQAAMLRAVIRKPQVIVLNGLLDDFSDLDTDALWQFFYTIRPERSVLIYLSGGPAPEQVSWTQRLQI